ncbi:MAG TPA: OmpA family protein [Micropepsaceae bacterium]|jgi:outer membrane protein OmpA-like peptidoglycan-associated protein|nr:OmpA family protein [Micropepsaceae bacterium]
MKPIVPLLLLSAAVFATPASANYFSNPALGVNLNVGSAPNPKPTETRTVTETAQTTERVVEAAPAPPPPPAPPAVAEAAPAPPPPPAPVATVRNFVVFFDFDKYNLTPEAREVVASAVNAAKTSGTAHITVTGHTDTVGSQRYNQRLSERRAASVKSEMVKLGMNDAEITTIGKSFNEPLVPTGPGVREPQNRRAMIDLGNPNVASLQ